MPSGTKPKDWVAPYIMATVVAGTLVYQHQDPLTKTVTEIISLPLQQARNLMGSLLQGKLNDPEEHASFFYHWVAPYIPSLSAYTPTVLQANAVKAIEQPSEEEAPRSSSWSTVKAFKQGYYSYGISKAAVSGLQLAENLAVPIASRALGNALTTMVLGPTWYLLSLPATVVTNIFMNRLKEQLHEKMPSVSETADYLLGTALGAPEKVFKKELALKSARFTILWGMQAGFVRRYVELSREETVSHLKKKKKRRKETLEQILYNIQDIALKLKELSMQIRNDNEALSKNGYSRVENSFIEKASFLMSDLRAQVTLGKVKNLFQVYRIREKEAAILKGALNNDFNNRLGSDTHGENNGCPKDKSLGL